MYIYIYIYASIYTYIHTYTYYYMFNSVHRFCPRSYVQACRPTDPCYRITGTARTPSQTHVCICMYIYIYRERERYRERCVYIYIYIYIYRARERERERERDTYYTHILAPSRIHEGVEVAPPAGGKTIHQSPVTVVGGVSCF